ncbi:AraC family transcriptional regulator [Vibrio sp. JC009]|uniref:AraC family transcriptional regulator n=1 Tax=Vibrio sp. JC009 TaxID=2912314 RepID=UPI0023AEA2D4|nr:AraC family transcriptional regulator [Vibrio sp. JC009]WED24330.1 AraC family transcriptional regulator [Vibrio sp. JC009]
MNYAIEYRNEQHRTLNVTPRKRVMKNSLLLVHEGLVLFKLKKFEYAVEKNQAFWLPFDCLTSMTAFPGSAVSVVDFSVRLKDDFPKHAGFVELPDVTGAVLKKLAKAEYCQEHTSSLLSVVKHEATELKPVLELSALSKQFNDWSFDKPAQLEQEIHIAMKIREARKQILSGTKRNVVIKNLFDDHTEEFEQLTKLVLGKSL